MNADGTVERTDDGRYVISFERRLAHPVDSVWDALTRPDRLIAWWGDADVELAEGGRFDVRWLNTDDEGNAAEHARHDREARTASACWCSTATCTASCAGG